MILKMESHDMENGKQLYIRANADNKTVSYGVNWTCNGEYNDKQFPEGEFKNAVDWYNSIRLIQ